MSLTRVIAGTLALAVVVAGCGAFGTRNDFGTDGGGAGNDGAPAPAIVSDGGQGDGGGAVADGAPEACGGPNQCAPAPPAGWEPVRLFQVPQAGAPVAFDCGDHVVGEPGWTAPRADPAVCSGCACTKASCSVSLECHVGATSCFGGTTTALAVGAACSGGQAAAPAGTTVATCIPRGTFTGAPCVPSTVVTTRPAPYDNKAFVCPGIAAGVGACGAGQTCIAPRPAGAALCVRNKGAATCPDATWSIPVQVYPNLYADNRSCTPCSCSGVGTTCAGQVTINPCSLACGVSGCANADATSLAVGLCADVTGLVTPGNWSASVTTPSTVVTTCTPSAPIPLGQVDRGTPALVCCRP